MFDGSKYHQFKNKPWRGARVKKLLKVIRRSKKDIRKSKKEISYFFADDVEKANNHGKYVALQKLRRYIRDSFGVETMDKQTFKRKLFSGIKISILLEYLDYQIKITEEELEEIEELIDIPVLETYFKHFLFAQISVFREFHDIVYEGKIAADDDDDEEGI